MAEAWNGDNGWAICGSDLYTEDEDRDNYESQQLFNVLETEVLPAFYERQGGDLPLRWIKRMKASIATGLGDFSSTRMVQEYDREFYRPAAAAYAKLTADGAAFARSLVETKRRLVENFDGQRIYIEEPQVEGDLSHVHVGDSIKLTVKVGLGGLSPEMVEVNAYYGTVNAHNEMVASHSVTLKQKESLGDGNYLYAGEISCVKAGRFGLTARIKAAGTDWDNSVPGFVCWPR